MSQTQAVQERLPRRRVMGGRIRSRALEFGFSYGFGQFVDLVSGRLGIGGGLENTPAKEVVEGAEAA